MGGQSLEFIWGSCKLVSSLLGNLRSDLLVEANISVESGSDGCASLGELTDLLESRLNPLNAHLNLLSIAREFLTEGQRSSILGVSSANLNDVLELLSLGYCICIPFC